MIDGARVVPIDRKDSVIKSHEGNTLMVPILKYHRTRIFKKTC